jgi:lipopolysaccharide/colanic/teichoic acid biosynthesis glycosyltransferase
MANSKLRQKGLDASRISQEVSIESLLEELPDSYSLWFQKAKNFSTYTYVNADLVKTFVHFALLRFEADRKPIYDFTRRIADFVVASIIILVFSPLLIACSIAVKISSPGPVLYKQLRVGFLGELFWIYKFRTMVEGAEKIRTLGVPLEKFSNDPRTTSVGRFLRRRKFDELPQLFNVLIGNMSMIGPRPLVIEETAVTPPQNIIRFAVRPGLGGLWQANHPNSISGELKMKLDCDYVVNRSWLLDLTLWCKSVGMFFKGEKD